RSIGAWSRTPRFSSSSAKSSSKISCMATCASAAWRRVPMTPTTDRRSAPCSSKGSALRLSVAAWGALLAAMAATPVGADDSAWQLPRTSDGQPLLQGYWTNTTVVPFERPASLADRTHLHEQEARERLERGLTVTETEAGTAADVHYQLTDFGLDNSQNTVVLDTRTSLVVDPPNGRIPAALPGAVARGA